MGKLIYLHISSHEILFLFHQNLKKIVNRFGGEGRISISLFSQQSSEDSKFTNFIIDKLINYINERNDVTRSFFSREQLIELSIKISKNLNDLSQVPEIESGDALCVFISNLAFENFINDVSNAELLLDILDFPILNHFMIALNLIDNKIESSSIKFLEIIYSLGKIRVDKFWFIYNTYYSETFYPFQKHIPNVFKNDFSLSNNNYLTILDFLKPVTLKIFDQLFISNYHGFYLVWEGGKFNLIWDQKNPLPALQFRMFNRFGRITYREYPKSERRKFVGTHFFLNLINNDFNKNKDLDSGVQYSIPKVKYLGREELTYNKSFLFKQIHTISYYFEFKEPKLNTPQTLEDVLIYFREFDYYEIAEALEQAILGTEIINQDFEIKPFYIFRKFEFSFSVDDLHPGFFKLILSIHIDSPVIYIKPPFLKVVFDKN